MKTTVAARTPKNVFPHTSALTAKLYAQYLLATNKVKQSYENTKQQLNTTSSLSDLSTCHIVIHVSF